MLEIGDRRDVFQSCRGKKLSKGQLRLLARRHRAARTPALLRIEPAHGGGKDELLILSDIQFAGAQPLYPLRITMIEEGSGFLVQRPYRAHILVA